MAEDDFMARYERERQEQAAKNAVALKVLFKDLRKAGVARVEVDYDGSGDSGDIQETTFFDAKDNKMEVDFDERCNDLAYGELETHHGGWEINEGSFGKVIFDVQKGKVRFEHNERVMESTYHESEDDVDAGDREENEGKVNNILDEMINSPKKPKKK